MVVMLCSEEMEERHDKIQREVVEAHHGVNFVIVRTLHTHTYIYTEILAEPVPLGWLC